MEKGQLKTPGDKKQSELFWYFLLFVVSFFGMMVAFIPTMQKNGGIFLYYGDFNSQQVMFYQHANEMVRNGNMAWDWGTDLGSNFIGSYSFYLLGSPFFWLSTLFPLDKVKYLLPWLLSLKTAVASVTAYAYIRRFVKTQEYAAVGGMLYAFSGFQVYNVFFNHFHDVTAFFPLLLLSFEQLTQDKRRGVFAVSVAILASISYFFFVCEVVFVVIYFFIRCMDKEFKIDFNKFISLCVEAVIGVLISGIILLPAVYDVLTNPRLDSKLYGTDIIFYGENVRIPRIIQAFFMMSDMPARVNILRSDNARWASIAGYLPLFAMSGVIAYFRDKWKNKKDFMICMVVISGIMMCVPILNSVYVAFNSSYYARWYYMPILIMCTMTAAVLDDNPEKLKKGYWISSIVGAFFLFIGWLPKVIDGVVTYGKNYQYEDLYKLQVTVTLILIAVLGVMLYVLPKNKNYKRITAAATAAACVFTMYGGVNFGAVQDGGHDEYIKYAINGKDNLDMDKLDNLSQVNHLSDSNTFYRIDTSENVDNWCMFWGLSSMRTFHSVVPSSIMDFYTSIGQTRDVASRMEPRLYGLRSMLSVRYYFNRAGDGDPADTIQDLHGFKYIDTQNDFDIYENQNWIPMGFTYDYYTTSDVIDNTDENKRPNVMLEAVVLDENQINKYDDILAVYNKTDESLSDEHFDQICEKKRNNSCYYFTKDTHGFEAKINLESDKLVFFSVPYEDGWTAKVNGADVQIEKVNYGLMAVRCPAGDDTIEFSYETAGLSTGKKMTVGGVVLLAAYLAVGYFVLDKKDRKRKKAIAKREAKKKELSEKNQSNAADSSAEDSADTSRDNDSDDLEE